MPLSPDEERILSEIEENFYSISAEDPETRSSSEIEIPLDDAEVTIINLSTFEDVDRPDLVERAKGVFRDAIDAASTEAIKPEGAEIIEFPTGNRITEQDQ